MRCSVGGIEGIVHTCDFDLTGVGRKEQVLGILEGWRTKRRLRVSDMSDVKFTVRHNHVLLPNGAKCTERGSRGTPSTVHTRLGLVRAWLSHGTVPTAFVGEYDRQRLSSRAYGDEDAEEPAVEISHSVASESAIVVSSWSEPCTSI